MVSQVVLFQPSQKGFHRQCRLWVSPCMVPQLIANDGVVSKWFPMKEMVKFFYMFSTILAVSRYFMRASNMAWSMEPNAFQN